MLDHFDHHALLRDYLTLRQENRQLKPELDRLSQEHSQVCRDFAQAAGSQLASTVGTPHSPGRYAAVYYLWSRPRQ